MDAILPVVISKGASLLKRGRSFLFSKPVSYNCRGADQTSYRNVSALVTARTSRFSEKKIQSFPFSIL